MDLTDYFEPVDFSTITEGNSSLKRDRLGYVVEKYREAINQRTLSKINIAIIGIPVDNGKRQKKEVSSPDAIRHVLYKLASIETNLKIADLGNLKPSKSHKGTLLALRDIVEYLNELNIIVIVLGGSQDLTLGICEAFTNDRFFWLSTIDAVLDVRKGTEAFNSTTYLTRLFGKIPHLFQFSLIGYQQHLTSELLISKTREIGNHLRLGELRDNIKKAELLLRNSNVLSFDMGALKFNEAPGTKQKNPNGLRGEEACQLAHYAGLSTRLSVFGIFETLTAGEDMITSALAAEIIWYFLKGVSGRRQNGLRTAYKVEIEGLDFPVIFKHEYELNRWWFDVQSVSGEIIEIACSEEEYQQAAANEIPERWLSLIQKMDKLLK